MDDMDDDVMEWRAPHLMGLSQELLKAELRSVEEVAQYDLEVWSPNGWISVSRLLGRWPRVRGHLAYEAEILERYLAWREDLVRNGDITLEDLDVTLHRLALYEDDELLYALLVFDVPRWVQQRIGEQPRPSLLA
ncbi:hypothetical protein [Deinococcus sp. NW-56]|uniref:hypothetical protein n=1 Tax=Deinococcus sp. NW-56 TaxID=2080419 RepID=UPI000CF554FF|nr:hypothetical protein [Deinococcus sp. NW-56]